MPGLTGKTVEASPSKRIPQPYQPQIATPAQKTSSSPVRPPIEPLSPILGPTRLATGEASSSKQTNAPEKPARKTFAHIQAATQYVAQPAPKPISLEENPDAIALRAAISILQMQKRKAEGDLVALQKVKERANEDPEGFRDALVASEIPMTTDGLFNLSKEVVEDSSEDGDGEDDEEDDEEGEDEAEDEDVDDNETGPKRNGSLRESKSEEDEEMMDVPEVNDSDPEQKEDEDVGDPMADSSSRSSRREKAKKWPPIPARQNVVRMPAINWSQYAVVGESLDKLHEDQRKKPTDGVPQRMGPDGRVKAVEGGKQRSQPAVIAAPYDPFKDKIEKADKTSTRKGGKR